MPMELGREVRDGQKIQLSVTKRRRHPRAPRLAAAEAARRGKIPSAVGSGSSDPNFEPAQGSRKHQASNSEVLAYLSGRLFVAAMQVQTSANQCKGLSSCQTAQTGQKAASP